MIGEPIGYVPIGAADFAAAQPVLDANIFLVGTLGYESSFRVASRVNTFLDFTIINNDDNVIQVFLTNILTNLPIDISGASAEVSIYAPGTNEPAILVLGVDNIVISQNYFTFSLAFADVSGLTAGNYPWVAILTLANGLRHTVNCGDIDLTTGVIKVVGRP